MGRMAKFKAESRTDGGSGKAKKPVREQVTDLVRQVRDAGAGDLSVYAASFLVESKLSDLQFDQDEETGRVVAVRDDGMGGGTVLRDESGQPVDFTPFFNFVNQKKKQAPTELPAGSPSIVMDALRQATQGGQTTTAPARTPPPRRQQPTDYNIFDEPW